MNKFFEFDGRKHIVEKNIPSKQNLVINLLQNEMCEWSYDFVSFFLVLCNLNKNETAVG